MHTLLCYLNRNQYLSRKLTCALLFALLLGPGQAQQAVSQSKPAAVGESSLCNRDNALEMIKQQIEFSKTFDSHTRRIAVLIRAADLLWPYGEDNARAVFAEAFELAAENEKENAQKTDRAMLQRLQIPDQRYVVIRSVAKRDSEWARALTKKMLKSPNDVETPMRGSSENLLTAARLLDSAYQMVPTHINAALDLARASLNYPASFALTRFLYRVSEVNQQAADQFYAEALVVYSDKPMREFLYLQAFPFGWSETINTPVSSYHPVPINFVFNQSLQRRFVQMLLRRAQQALQVPLDEGDTYRSANVNLMPGTVHLLQSLLLLEPQVRASLPDLLIPLTQTREKILVTLTVETQRLLLQPGREISMEPNQTFDEQVELAQKTVDVNECEDMIANAVLTTSSTRETVAIVVNAIDKISNAELRAALLEWVYFHRATNAVQEKRFEEAERLTSRVEGLEQRAYLHSEIARGLLNGSVSQTQGREVLDEAIAEARKVGATLFAARTLLTAANLYTKMDRGRSVSLLSDAINCINRVEAPDFSSDDQTLEKKPERKVRGGQYGGEYSLRFYMPGPQPETAFREMAKIDFDTTLAQSIALTDKFQRALTTLGMAESCLAQSQQPPKAKPKKVARPSA